ncbi:nuclear export mediator factor Nemf [Striga asiatica]|uniref:Nuclear export mediator factor Nemf n=1 Tax=Striga asiatica TaxID=4170 RepID=A0A5A7P6L2_STRAF|nr:nuclear export mediator factor Nemf [Striga asiatica]
MVKVRMNTADVAAEVKCLRRLIGMRCSNVYDLSPKTYVFKLMSSSGVTESGESEKVLLLMESGVRDKSNTPSGFTLKLRKHIRTRRLEDVRQLGYDRIILFQFGQGVNAHYVILELYAQGNVILTDSEFTVLTLLRSHRCFANLSFVACVVVFGTYCFCNGRDDDKGIAIMSRHRYPVEQSRTFERTTREKMSVALQSLVEVHRDDNLDGSEHGHDSNHALTQKHDNQRNVKPSQSKKSDNARAKQATLKVVLGEALGYGPALSEHIILDAGLIPSTKISKDINLDDNTIHLLAEAVLRFEDWLADVIFCEKVPEGYILMQQKNSGKRDGVVSEKGTSEQIYDEFCPLLLNQFKSRDSVQFETFDAALDEFYSKIESQRSEQQQKAKENSAMQRLDKIKIDQESRVHALKREVEQSIKKAELIEYNLEDVDAAILAVRVALANGMSWVDLARMVKEEKKSGNPVAGLIDKLHLERNCITLLLSNNLDDMDDEEKTQPVDKVEVDLALSAHANARRYYEMKKKQESKQEKTVTAHEKAFKAAERKTRQQLSQSKNDIEFTLQFIVPLDMLKDLHVALSCKHFVKLGLQEKAVASITHMRKVHWFEKFNWFISSENYLVISGRDAQQNEMIVKRYMSKGDLYVHAELHGASSTVIKNHKPEVPVPPLTLNQAGCYTVCQSQAWDSKIVTSAWWVYPHQVSKTAPTGEYLTVGSFMIRGKKNFLPPHPLIMGFGILFRLDESSLGSHLNERRVRGEEEGLNDTEQSEPFQEISDSGSDSEKELFGAKATSDSSNLVDLSPVVQSSDLNGFDVPVKLDVADETSTSANHISNDEELESSSKTSAITSDLEDLMDRALELGPATASVKKYGLQYSKEELVEEHNLENAVQRDKPYISKAERRNLKKGPKDDAASSSAAIDKQKEEHKKCVSQAENDSKNPKPSGGKPSRGQRGKLKKIKEKYADQDEEERSIRMALLAAAGKSKKKTEKSEIEKVTSERGPKPATEPVADDSKICYKCKKAGHMSRDCPEHPDATLPSTKAGGEVDRVTMEEDDIHEIGEEEREKLNDVDYLTGNPLPNDVLLYAVPVCGPYNALQSYKYRVKIIPGTLKKGKAAKTAMNLFSHTAEATMREKELMKACTDSELVAAIISNVKVSAAGLTQLKQKQKKTKKAANKGGS